MSDFIQAADVSDYSGLITQAQWEQVKRRGIELAIVGAWHGTEANQFARDTIYNARLADLDVAAYTVLNSMDGSKTVHEGFRACGDQSNFLAFMALDVEELGVTHQIFNDAHNALVSAESKGCVYSRYSFWHGNLGNPGWGVDLPLWDARYDGDPHLILTTQYGSWTQENTVGKQYQGSNSRLGINADLSVFARDWWK